MSEEEGKGEGGGGGARPRKIGGRVRGRSAMLRFFPVEDREELEEGCVRVCVCGMHWAIGSLPSVRMRVEN